MKPITKISNLALLTVLLSLFTVFLPQQANAQTPEKMSYQAVVRNASDALVVSQTIGMEISILQGGVSGTVVYVETHTPMTNINGLVSLEIGTGTTTDDFSSINWSAGPYFIKTEADPNGGISYSITGTSQLMSVPYAMYAITSENVMNDLVDDADADPYNEIELPIGGTSGQVLKTDGIGNYEWANQTALADGSETKVTAGTNVSITGVGTLASPYEINATGGGSAGTRYLGEAYGGGIIYYLYIGSDGNQHGLIVNKNESTAIWQATATTTGADRSYDGAFNTALMTNSAAATYVNGLSDGGFTDWYVPSLDELALLYNSRFSTNKALASASGTLLSITALYWSSTEYDTTYAYYFRFGYGTANYYFKNLAYWVRAVRSF